MKWHELGPLPQFQKDEEVFFGRSQEGVRRLRHEYSELACRACGKFDEFQALDLGVSNLQKFRVRADIATTGDFCTIVSSRFAEVCRNAGIASLGFVPVNDRFFAVRPNVIVPVDISRSEIDFRGRKPCMVCGRFAITCHSPSIESMRLPQDRLSIVAPALRPETKSVAMSYLVMTADVATILKDAELVGINWLLARDVSCDV